MCILLNVKKHEKTFALNVDIFTVTQYMKILLQSLGNYYILNTVRLNGKAL